MQKSDVIPFATSWTSLAPVLGGTARQGWGAIGVVHATLEVAEPRLRSVLLSSST